MKAHYPSAAEWRTAYLRAPDAVTHAVARVVDGHTAELATVFYRELLTNTEAQQLLPPPLLQERLFPAIQRWMQFLFDPANAASPSPTIALQRHVGELHARAGIPQALVAHGFRCFKRALTDRLAVAELAPPSTLWAVLYAGELIDLAQAEMAVAHEQAATNRFGGALLVPDPAPAAAYPPQLELERNAQLVALSDEENRFLRSMLSTVADGEVGTLGSSPFGIWLNHKAPLLFEDAAQTAALSRISQTIAYLDTAVLPQLQAGLQAPGPVDDTGALLREVVTALEDVRGQVNTLFDRLASTEGYRDALTQLFNRTLLASMLRREVELARRKRTSFSVLLVNIDDFAQVNLDNGAATGDRVLQKVATLLTSHVRASDFVFRSGQDEFLILLVELDEDQSVAVAEKIRRAGQSTDFQLAEDFALRVTLSVGVAVFDGQQTPHDLTALAAQALSCANAGGGNQVSVAQ